MGDASHLHHVHLHGLEKLSGHRDVEAHAYSSGRYKVRIEPHDGKDHSHDEPTTESYELKNDPLSLKQSQNKKEKAGAELIDSDAASS